MDSPNPTTGGARSKIAAIFVLLVAIGTIVVGLAQLAPGAYLVALRGSPYYALIGVVLVACGVQLIRRRRSAQHLFMLAFVATWIWALAEVGLDGWALLPRVDLVCGMLPFIFLPVVDRSLSPDGGRGGIALLRRFYVPGAAVMVAVVVALIGVNAWRAGSAAPAVAEAQRPAGAASATDWRHIGHDAFGQRFSSLSEIDRGNAAGLERVWEHVEAAAPRPADRHRKDEATPLQVGDKVFVCLTDNTVLALDAETGQLRWRHDPKVDATAVPVEVCRGLAYYEDLQSAQCPRRILTATIDARLIALDADTGRPCEDFGQGGEISLKAGLGPVEPGTYYATSPPTVTRGLAIVGALVKDNASVGLPSGVVRAFDAHTGELAWAWDLGRAPGRTGPLGEGEIYTRGTPNAWSYFSADDKLGLVYLPMGNSTPDFVGSYRKPEWEKYASSVVALDVATGTVRWSYQLTHHDLWDYDVSAQPVLFDMPTAAGPVPALLQATKQGDLYVLDRRTGAPLSAVVEKPTPQTDVPGEWTSKTQPFSVDMPNVGGPRLREADMWGVSPFDQLWCRLQFHRLRYEGVFTPPSLRGSIHYPGQAGGVDWGSVSIDEARHLLFVPSFRLATNVRLIPREEGAKSGQFTDPQSGTPYMLANSLFLTRLGVPCQRPPYSLLTAIDLRTKKVVWTRPLGTAEELGPRGIASHLPFTIGAPPLLGGPVATAGDVVFIAAVGDWRLRAIDSLSGRELWSAKLPEGGQATPITYRAPKSGRQMVVFVSGAYADIRSGRNSPTHVVAYALP